MPIYEYRCRKGHTFEVMQSMSDDPITACSECGALVERVYHPVAVHFKGSGFYTTDYGRKRSGAGDSASGGDGAKDKTDAKESASEKSDGSSASDKGTSSEASSKSESSRKSESSSKSTS